MYSVLSGQSSFITTSKHKLSRHQQEVGSQLQTQHSQQQKKTKTVKTFYFILSIYNFLGQRGGEWGKQVGSMNEESQVRGCYTITFIYTNQETVRLSPESDA